MKRWPLEALFAGSGGVAFPRMTALVGAGGKTTLMYALARRMADAGRRVVCTTTTRFSRRRMAFPWFSWKARPIPLPPSTMR